MAITITIEMPGYGRPSRLIDLPWEVRRPIIVEVLQRRRKTMPSFSRKLVESRVRLRNCFEEQFPDVTNFYVPRHRNRYLHGNALRATNRQLRYETNLVIQEELKSGNLDDIPFTLDIMVVKGIGVFPTWMSFPYQPTHIKELTINVRIVRPGTCTVPDQWVEAARYEDDEFYSDRETSPTLWNVFIMAVVLYSFGCFSVKPDPARPPIERDNQQPPAAEEAPSAKKQARKTRGSIKASSKLSSKLGARSRERASKSGVWPDLIDHQSGVLNAYILPSPSYVVDKLFIDFKNHEYDFQNKPILPSDKGSSNKESRFYKEGCVQFGRDVFRDFSAAGLDRDELQDEQDLISTGKHACHQLQESICHMFWSLRSPGVRRSAYGPYLDMLARSVGDVDYSPCRGSPSSLRERQPCTWALTDHAFSALLDGYSWAAIERDLAKEMASAFPDEDLLEDLCLLQIRGSHGWIPKDEVI